MECRNETSIIEVLRSKGRLRTHEPVSSDLVRIDEIALFLGEVTPAWLTFRVSSSLPAWRVDLAGAARMRVGVLERFERVVGPPRPGGRAAPCG